MSQSLATRPARDSVALARVREIVEQLAARDRSGEVLTAVHHIPAREAKFAPMPDWVRADLAAVYGEKGVGQLYSHQAVAAAAVHAGRNTVVVTPTASGKTLCYNLPVLNAVLENSNTRALYLFPTKALAQDQLSELHDLSARLDHRFGVFTYDGDTPADARKAIRERGHIVLSNPDMLHLGGALPIRTWESEHVIGKHCIADRAIGRCPIDKELAVDVKIKRLVKALAANVGTKLDGVRADNFADTVRPLE